MSNVCARCLMGISDPSIKFNNDRACDHCLTFDQTVSPALSNNTKNDSKINKIVESIKLRGVGKGFDCNIGLSGGIDSSNLALPAKNCGLRPLLFHVDEVWNFQEAVNNIEKLVDGLGRDLFTEVIGWDEMLDLQLEFLKSGVPHINAPRDHAFFATMYKSAENNNIKSILTDANFWPINLI